MRGTLRGSAFVVCVAAAAIIGSLVMPSPAGATMGPTNNFGSTAGLSDTENVLLGDSSAQDYSMWPVYMGWTSSEKTFYRTMINNAVESVFEPSDLTVTMGSDGSSQDVRFVPLTTDHPTNPDTIADTTCITSSAYIAGSHHARLCDHKQVTIYKLFFDGVLTGDQMAYMVIAHEFGHAVGARHSLGPCLDYLTNNGCVGVGLNGERQWNSFTPQPGTVSLMYPYANGSSTTSLSLYDYANINAHY